LLIAFITVKTDVLSHEYKLKIFQIYHRTEFHDAVLNKSNVVPTCHLNNVDGTELQSLKV
jgi:hypothetical protein